VKKGSASFLKKRSKKLLSILAVSTLLLSNSAKADQTEDFYKSQDLTILIGHPPGGSYDIYAELAARHLKDFIPGHPNVIVQSMPGGGGSKATAYFYNRAPQDGSYIGLFPETIVYVQLMDPVQGKWDVTKMHYLGSFAPVNTAFLGHKGGAVSTVDDLKTKSISVGCSGRTSQSYQYPAVLKAETGWKLKLICGYEGSSAYTLALLRNEVDVISKAWNSSRAEDRDALADGSLIPILQGGLKRVGELPQVPLMQEMVSDPKAKQVLEFISGGAAIGRALIAPPRTPPERLAALSTAFDAMVKDPGFKADADKSVIYLEPTSGKDVQAVSDAIAHTPKDVVATAQKAFEAE
jgi:tripartite-type tricarboxylate transporter receptor subunit TctC